MNRPYTLPPEWSPQSGVMLTWPHKQGDWGAILSQVEAELLQLAKVITQYELLLVSYFDEAHQEHLSRLFRDNGVELNKCRFFIVPSNDVWARDHGPITVYDENQEPTLLDFKFNGWGDKYPWQLDNQITTILHQQGAFGEISIEPVELVLEGGSIEIDGRSTLLTTSSSLLNKNRNNLTQSQIEAHLKNRLGVKQILCLTHGHLTGDDTDGHIDTLARFINPYNILYVHCDDPHDEHYDRLNAMKGELQNFKNIDNQGYNLIPLPWPSPQYGDDGKRLPLTYANFLMINDALLLPNYGIPEDRTAKELFIKLFPNRRIYPLPSRELIKQLGSLHCATMQLPSGVLL